MANIIGEPRILSIVSSNSTMADDRIHYPAIIILDSNSKVVRIEIPALGKQYVVSPSSCKIRLPVSRLLPDMFMKPAPAADETRVETTAYMRDASTPDGDGHFSTSDVSKYGQFQYSNLDIRPTDAPPYITTAAVSQIYHWLIHLCAWTDFSFA